ncbi:unnamed protein product [Hermetia illucens]|uniref:Ig-like domain-containing protein n=1 Tax=Hermetia illucens TaxID=343691 RepID=A0A7R8UFC9_HERIL|nr:uncharacterized protein LOC119657186 isoform X1 [Hermetia illucens]XP_037919918.1 uncharacterized protein LOC119657186 isoform X2 [Hermetia illucens]CAD7079798.1 unnamed protein product [Hermetia illucens]
MAVSCSVKLPTNKRVFERASSTRISILALLMHTVVVCGSRGSQGETSNGSGPGDENSLGNSVMHRGSGPESTSYHSPRNYPNPHTNNLMMIGLSSCQTVCACKWKGGKQTVECIDRSLITIPENIDASTQVLDMSGNNLQILPHEQFIRANLLNLQKLYLRNCRLGQIDDQAFKGLTNLVELDLSHNLLTAVPSTMLSYIPSLRDLTLASNPIQKIESHSFKTIRSLNKLDLSHCDIQTVAPQAFDGLDALHSLKLNGNKLMELQPRTVETLSELHGVELHDNPWMCDCRLRAAKIWLTTNNIPYPVAPVCAGGPERVIDRTFSELHVDDFACRPEMLPVSHYVKSVAGDNASITCKSSAIPAPNVNWYWNGRLLVNGSTFSTYQRVYIFEDGQFEKRSRLVLTNSQETDSSEFYCVAENKAGTAEANFTLHVSMRAAGMASLGSGQIVGLSAALVILILFVLLIILFLLVRLKRTPFIESKTPNHLEVITAVNQQNSISCKQQPSMNNIGGGPHTNALEVSGMEHKIGGNSNDVNNPANPVQKPPRLTDLAYTTSNYDNSGSVLSGASCFVSPTASAGNNPDLINDTKRFGSGDFADLKIPSVLSSKDCLDPISAAATLGGIERPGSGEYSRAGGCDSLYPSGLWESNHQNHSDDMYLKRATSTTIPGYSYTDKTPIIDNTQMYDMHERTSDFLSKTFPRTHFGAPMSSASATSSIPGGNGSTATTATTLSASLGGSVGSGYPSDYGLPLVPGAEQHIQHTFQQFNHNNNSVTALGSTNGITSSNNNNNSSSKLCTSLSSSSTSASTSIPSTSTTSPSTNPLVTSNHHHQLPAVLPNGMPINAKTIRVWQKGGVPVLPPVTALKRALISSSRNSPDEGYQEGCGTDV